jgi:hypothetical protein
MTFFFFSDVWLHFYPSFSRHKVISLMHTKIAAALLFLTTSLNLQASAWDTEFFSPLQNELPPAHGVVVDELGYTHLQVFNRKPGDSNYFQAQLYTLNSAGQAPWMSGLQSIEHKSDCGVFAKYGQRLDCFEPTGFVGYPTTLVMRSPNSAKVVWQSELPVGQSLLDASITQENVALVVGKGFSRDRNLIQVINIDSNGAQTFLGETRACPTGAEWIDSKLRMPKNTGETIRELRTCRNSVGTELSVNTFDPAIGK